METIKNFQTLKQELKQFAVELHDDKATLRKSQRGDIPFERDSTGMITNHPSTLQYLLLKKKRLCRHKHIAYSMMKGHTYEQIEPKCRADNKPDQDLIQEFIDVYGTQNVRACA
jgi:hypothetical protein